MKLLKNLILTSALLGGVVLSGCSSSNTGPDSNVPSETGAPQAAQSVSDTLAPAATETPSGTNLPASEKFESPSKPKMPGSDEKVSFSEGVKKMKQINAKLQTILMDNKVDELQNEANELDESWETIEDPVKDKNKDLYNKVEASIGSIKAGSKLKPLDVKSLKDASKNLDKALDEVLNLDSSSQKQ